MEEFFKKMLKHLRTLRLCCNWLREFALQTTQFGFVAQQLCLALELSQHCQVFVLILAGDLPGVISGARG